MLSLSVIVILLGIVVAAPDWTLLRAAESVEQDNVLRFQKLDMFEDVWSDFKKEHDKEYENEKEEVTRKEIFRDNMKEIEMHNYLHDQGARTFQLGVNKFADLKSEEFTSMMNGYIMRNNSMPRKGGLYMSPLVKIDVPDSVDWREKGYVTPVKNQGQCGSCWSFSATGSLEGQHFRKAGKMISLSEQNLVDCSTQWGNNGCNGGLMDDAFQYIEDNHGIDTEDAYPYTAEDGVCHFEKSGIGATDVGFTDVPSGDENALKEALATVGPVSIAIDASRQTFQLYKSGVYVEPTCSSTQLDHGVLAVGYGTMDGQDYWIVKNSWGPEWGKDGYIYMARNKDNQCGVATAASYPNV